MVGIDGLQAGDPVTSEQMLALFGAGMHPLAAHRLQQLSDANLSDDQVRAATRLGAPFKVMRTTPIDSRSRSPDDSLPLPDRATCLLPIGGTCGRR
jgi:hypothetical protein